MIKSHLQILTFWFYLLQNWHWDDGYTTHHENLGLMFPKDLNLLQLMPLQNIRLLWKWEGMGCNSVFQCSPFNTSLTAKFSEDPSEFYCMHLAKLHSIKLWCLSLHNACLGPNEWCQNNKVGQSTIQWSWIPTIKPVLWYNHW